MIPSVMMNALTGWKEKVWKHLWC